MDNKFDTKYIHIYKNIGSNVKRIRNSNNWTQQDLADKCDGVTRAKISKIENAYQDYMLSTLLEVCNALGKSIEDITREYPKEEITF